VQVVQYNGYFLHHAIRRRRERERTQAAEALSQEQAPRPEMGLSLVWYPVWVCVTPCLGG
jgi:hypothetical protein